MFYIYSSTVIFPRYNSKLFKVLPMHRKMKMHESNNTQYLEAEHTKLYVHSDLAAIAPAGMGPLQPSGVEKGEEV